MAIDASIALGIKPIQFENPLNNMVKFSNIQNDMQTNQMNQMKMNEANRLQGVNARFSSDLSNLGDPNAPDYENNLRQAYIRKNDIPGYQAHVTADLANQKTRGDIQKQAQEYAGSIARDLGRNSSDANTTAWFEDSMDSHLFSPDQKVKITNEYGKLMAMALPERKAYLLAQNASVAEAKPTTYQQDVGGSTNIVSVPAFGGAPTVLSSTKKTLNPDQALGVPVGYDEGSVSLQAKNDSLNAKLAELNAPGTTPERAKALEGEIQQDRRSISAQQQDQESMRLAAQQAKQPRQELENLLRDRAALVAKLGPAAKNDPVVNGMTARINFLTTHPGQEPVDPRKVANTVPGESGSIDQFNIYGQKIGHYEGVAKPSAQFIKTREQTKTLGKNLDLAIAELENATKDGGLIDQSTGSGLGKLANTARGFITGGASKGAIAGAKLAPIADLGLKMVPRFEGPQSDKDTQSYKEASGQLADTSIPNEIRKDAGKTVLRLLKARKGQFVTPEMAAQGEAPAGGIAPPAGFVAD